MNTLTHHVKSHSQHCFAVVLLGAWLGNATAPNARAQLAITEVMSDAATNCAGVVTNHPDFWELTNLGSNLVSLAGYRFWDKDPVQFDLANLLPDTNIAPGESIIFVRQSTYVPDAAAFREWWGQANLPTNLQIYFYKDPGFNGEGEDGVRLWDANTNLVDEVFFDQAVLDQGITFVADTNTGRFGVLSQIGVCGTFKAASCDDIGSPGFAPCGPVPMRITQESVSQTVDAGSPVTFCVGAVGRPIPRGHQWFFNGTPVPSPQPSPDVIPVVVSYAGCGLAWKTQPDSSDLVIPDAQPSHAGQYFVVITNGLEKLTSAVATLTVNTNPIAPQIECPATEWWFPQLPVSTCFSMSNLVNVPSFAAKLKAPKDAVSTFLKTNLSAVTTQALAAYTGGSIPPGSPLSKYLVQDLNGIIWGSKASLYEPDEPERFANVTLRSETQQLLAQNPQGADLVRLNRLLIEDAYPLEMARNTGLVLSDWPWQRAIFDVRVRAYPPPTFRWSWSPDGNAFADLPDATNRSLVINYVGASQAGTYRVRVQNKYGTNFAYATLAVKPKPALRITEVMPFVCQRPNGDWWELTNTGNEPVNLTGYRWNDYPGNVGGGPAITNAILIQPGESVIFMESQTRQSFLDWWGETNLPPNLQCIVHNANGLTETGDEITLWNQSASDKTDFIDTVVFGTATQGASFWFDSDFCPVSGLGVVSVERECGVFRSAQGCDIGSPGWTRWTPPCLTAVRPTGNAVTLWWKAQPGSLNRLQFTRELATPPADTVWTDVGAYTFAGATGTATHGGFQNDPQRFYRIVRDALPDCPCPE